MVCSKGADESVDSIVPSAQNSMLEEAGDVEAVQSVPLVTVSPSLMELVKVGVMVEVLTVTVAEAEALPPEPVQEILYIDVAVGVTVWEPEVALVPLQAPEAEQEVALVLLQERVLDDPEVIEVGLAVRETVGVVGGGVVEKPMLAAEGPIITFRN